MVLIVLFVWVFVVWLGLMVVGWGWFGLLLVVYCDPFCFAVIALWGVVGVGLGLVGVVGCLLVVC